MPLEQEVEKKGIAAAMSWKPDGKTAVFDLLTSLHEGDPRCEGKVQSQLLGDVEVQCSTPGRPQILYEFRVLLDGKRPPRPANPAAERLLSGMHSLGQ